MKDNKFNEAMKLLDAIKVIMDSEIDDGFKIKFGRLIQEYSILKEVSK